MNSAKYFLVILLCVPFATRAQEIINIYPDVVPNSKITTKKETTSNSGVIRGISKPTLEIYLPEKDKANGSAVIICPGGSYAVLVYQGEGIRTAKEFAKNGVTAFILKYRIPDDSILIDRKTGPLLDAQQAIKVVRENAAKWGIETNKIGIVGFSAGGHLASTLITHFKKPLIENKNNTSLRPDFAVLVYPVISMQDSLTEPVSRRNLLGNTITKELINEYSSELLVDETTPPTYLTHASDDKLVDVDNSIAFYESLRHHKVAAELHIYAEGGHGFIFSPKAEGWMIPIFKWMKNSGFIK